MEKGPEIDGSAASGYPPAPILLSACNLAFVGGWVEKIAPEFILKFFTGLII